MISSVRGVCLKPDENDSCVLKACALLVVVLACIIFDSSARTAI